MEFRILGSLEVDGVSRARTFRQAKPRAVLAALLLHANRPVGAEQLAAAVWGEEAPAGSARTVQVYISRLRKAFDDDGRIATAPTGYRLRVEPGELDRERFERGVAEGRAELAGGRPERASALLVEALELWRGPPLPELQFSAQAEIARLEEVRLIALETRVDAELALGRHADVVAGLSHLLSEHPTRERLAELLMLALYRCGRQADALEVYGRVRHGLVESAGLEPGPALQRLQKDVLVQSPALELPEADVEGPLVGRDAELERLRAYWAAARSGAGRVVAIAGPAGIGKTRLAAELAREVARSGHDVRHRLDGSDAVTRPTLVVIEGHVLPRDVGPEPVLVLACARDSRDAADTLVLEPLGAEAVGQIAPGVPTDWLLDESGGVPRRVHELARAWRQREAALRVRAAAQRTASERASLRETEDELTGEVLELDALRERQVADARGCPFKGLAAFDVEDAPYFFGRERLVAELTARLVGAPLLGVVGPSGSGKSSVLRAGLLAALRRGVLPGSANWSQAIIRPGKHPLRELAANDGCALLAVDQFEETFTVCRDEAERAAFIAELVSGRRIVVLALRADHYGRCGAYPDLARALAAHHVLVSGLRRAEYRRAVEGPARRAGLRVEAALTDALVGDVEREPGALPLLSTALLELWQRRDGPHLRLADYEATGGVRGAVARHAEDAFARLDPAGQAAARDVLMRLVIEGEDGAVERRRVPLDEVAGTDVVAALTDERLLTTGSGHVELAHEALLREWPRLRGWLEQDVEGRRLHRHLADAARDWEARGRAASELYRGARLAAALEWQTGHGARLNAVESEFLRAGAHGLHRRRRVAASAVALLAVIAVVSTALAVRGVRDAQQRQRADESRALATQALAHRDDNLALAGLLSLEAYRIEPTAEARSAALSVLPSLAAYPRLGAPLEHRAGLHGIAISPDGRTLASAADNGLWLWNLATRRPLAPLLSRAAGVLAVAFSHDGRFVASGGADGTARVWDVDARTPVGGPLDLGVDVVNSVTFSPDDRILATGGANIDQPSLGFHPAIRLWDVSSGHPLTAPLRPTLQTLFAYDSEVPAIDVEFSPDGTLLAIASGDEEVGGVQFLDVRSRRLDGTSLDTATDIMVGVTFSPDGTKLATAGGDAGRVELWDVRRRARLGRPLRADVTWNAVRSVAFSRDGRTLATGGDDATVRLWDVATRRLTRVLVSDSDSSSRADGLQRDPAVLGLAFGADDVLASARETGAVQLWRVKGGRPLSRALTGSRGWVRGVAFIDAPISAGLDRTLRFWGAGGRAVPVDGEVLALAADLRGRTVAVAGDDGLLRLYDARTQRLLGPPPRGHRDTVAAVALDSDGTTLASGDGEGTVRLWDVGSSRSAAALDVGDAVHALAFRPGHDDVLAVVAGDGPIRLWDVRERRPLGTLNGPAGFIDTLAFRPDGEQLASAGRDGTVWLWDVDEHRPAGPPLTGHTDVVDAVAFSPDGRTLASSGADRTVRLWDVASGEPLGLPLRGHGREVSALAFGPHTLVSAGQDQTVRTWDPILWSADADALHDRLCGTFARDLTRTEWAQFLPTRPYHATCRAP